MSARVILGLLFVAWVFFWGGVAVGAWAEKNKLFDAIAAFVEGFTR